MSGYIGLTFKKQVTTYNTLADLGLVLLSDFTIGSPRLKTEWIDIPGADGSLNASYALTDGEPRYEMRPVSFGLAKPGAADVSAEWAALAALIHGKKIKLYHPAESGWYYDTVLELEDPPGYGDNVIRVSGQAQPYALKDSKTLVSQSVGTTQTSIVLQNRQRPAVPTIQVSPGSATLLFKGVTYNIPANVSTTIPAMRLTEGGNTVRVTASAASTISFQYQEAHI